MLLQHVEITEHEHRVLSATQRDAHAVVARDEAQGVVRDGMNGTVAANEGEDDDLRLLAWKEKK